MIQRYDAVNIRGSESEGIGFVGYITHDGMAYVIFADGVALCPIGELIRA